MKTLTLRRTHIKGYSENKVAVLVNGKVVAKLKDNETKNIEIKDETVEIQARFLKWFGSKKQTVNAKEHTTVEVVTVNSWYNQIVITSAPMIVALSSLFYNHQTFIFFILLLLAIGFFIHVLFFRKNTWFTLDIK